MSGSTKPIYLASRSLRRRELLRQIGIGFELLLLREEPRRGIDGDENPHPGEAPFDYALRVAGAKAQAGFAAVARRRGLVKPVLAADTTIALDGRIIGKPRDAEDAVHILAALSGRSHGVITAVAMAYADQFETRVSESVVTMDAIDEARIRRYVASGEPMDKAGAYAVQGRAAAFISRVEGSYSGIMGLPLAETAALLNLFGIEV
ncbi:MAG: septum formation inhibitor Maf [Betaproteobacteria bacterium]|nr:septum formation inhibitor Maf [Betaproteobacteria bacterium]